MATSRVTTKATTYQQQGGNPIPAGESITLDKDEADVGVKRGLFDPSGRGAPRGKRITKVQDDAGGDGDGEDGDGEGGGGEET